MDRRRFNTLVAGLVSVLAVSPAFALIPRRNYFTDHELACSHCGRLHFNAQTLEKLNKLREWFGEPLYVTSGYRCPEYNAAIGGGPAHPTGRAVDIAVSGEAALLLVAAAPLWGFTGVGIKQTGPHGRRFVHLDDLPGDARTPRPWIWGY